MWGLENGWSITGGGGAFAPANRALSGGGRMVEMCGQVVRGRWGHRCASRGMMLAGDGVCGDRAW